MVELLIALTLASMLLTAVMVSLDVSFRAYRASAEEVSTNVQGRIIVERLQALIRAGADFTPLPASPLEDALTSARLDIEMPEGDWVTVQWNPISKELLWTDAAGSWPLMEGVTQETSSGEVLMPFRLEFHDGRWLVNATVDLIVDPQLTESLDLEGDQARPLRFTGSARPRVAAWAGR